MTQLSAGCALNPCLNGGTCFGFNNGPPLESSGRELSDTIDTVIGGSTTNNNEHSDRIYRCQCSPGWTGDYCQWSDVNTMLITRLILNTTEPEMNRPSGQPANATESAVTFSTEVTSTELVNQGYENNGKLLLSPLTTDTNYIENNQVPLSAPLPHHLDMKHLISGVVIASVFGVFLASLLLAWCCLVAIERNRFPFIQMNIIRRGDDEDYDGPAVSSTLRRMHGKIRDSLRLPSRSSRIKPETKLSIENVLRPPRPPPSYEESSSNYQNVNRISIEYPIYHRS